MLFRSSHGLSAENISPDLLSSAISIYKVSFRSVIAVHHCAQPASLQESYRVLISTCYFALLDGLSAENMIPD